MTAGFVAPACSWVLDALRGRTEGGKISVRQNNVVHGAVPPTRRLADPKTSPWIASMASPREAFNMRKSGLGDEVARHGAGRTRLAHAIAQSVRTGTDSAARPPATQHRLDAGARLPRLSECLWQPPAAIRRVGRAVPARPTTLAYRLVTQIGLDQATLPSSCSTRT